MTRYGRHCVHLLKSSSFTSGSFFRNATTDQISVSSMPVAPKLGMPVMLMPFLTTQNSCCGVRSFATSLRWGGSGCRPSEILAHSTLGPP